MAALLDVLRSLKFWAVLNGGLVALLVGAALFSSNGVVRKERLSEELGRLRTLNDEVSTENDRLRLEARALRHDPAYVEAVIRDELGWVREDESVFLVAPGDDVAGAAAPQREPGDRAPDPPARTGTQTHPAASQLAPLPEAIAKPPRAAPKGKASTHGAAKSSAKRPARGARAP